MSKTSIQIEQRSTPCGQIGAATQPPVLVTSPTLKKFWAARAFEVRWTCTVREIRKWGLFIKMATDWEVSEVGDTCRPAAGPGRGQSVEIEWISAGTAHLGFPALWSVPHLLSREIKMNRRHLRTPSCRGKRARCRDAIVRVVSRSISPEVDIEAIETRVEGYSLLSCFRFRRNGA